MEIDKDGGSAFPIQHSNEPGAYAPEPGMSLRDYFAAQVMSHMISLSTDADGGWSAENVAHGCYNLADAMLAARKDGETRG